MEILNDFESKRKNFIQKWVSSQIWLKDNNNTKDQISIV